MGAQQGESYFLGQEVHPKPSLPARGVRECCLLRQHSLTPLFNRILSADEPPRDAGSARRAARGPGSQPAGPAAARGPGRPRPTAAGTAPPPWAPLAGREAGVCQAAAEASPRAERSRRSVCGARQGREEACRPTLRGLRGSASSVAFSRAFCSACRSCCAS